MSASAIGLASTNAVLPILPSFKKEDLQYVTLGNTVNIGTAANPNNDKRKAKVVSVHEPNVELILRSIVEFKDVCSAGRLNLSTGALKFQKYRECHGNVTLQRSRGIQERINIRRIKPAG